MENNENKIDVKTPFFKRSEVIIAFIALFLLVSVFIVRYFYIEYHAEPRIELKGEQTVYLKVNEKYKEAGVKATLNSKNISNKVKIEGKIDSSVVKNYIIKYSVANNKGRNKKTIERKVIVLDSVKPVLKLKGKKKMKVSLNEEFKDPGYSAEDNVDGDITNKVKVYNKVNTTKAGGYEILYEVKDSSNNKSFIKRVVTVADYDAPVLSLKGSKTIKLKTNSEFKEPGYSAIDNIDGNLTNEVKIKGKVKTKTPGVYKLTYYVSDEADNYSSVLRTVYVGSAKERAKMNSIKVSISSQHLWYYKNGELFLSTSVVTGQAGSHDTPRGTFKIYGKSRNVTLRGRDYASPVSYWMPIYGGVGLHDATWRGSFGGTIYKRNGSHGCINLPYWAAQKLFNNAPLGTLVYVY